MRSSYEKKSLIIILFSSLFFVKCLYKDYTFKENLANQFYLMEGEMLPCKYICLENEHAGLVIIYDVIEIIGNKEIILVKTENDKKEHLYSLIEIDKVEYPEDVKNISYEEFVKQKKKFHYDYLYDKNNGFSRKLK